MSPVSNPLFPLPFSRCDVSGFLLYETALGETMDWPEGCMIALDREDEKQLVQLPADPLRKQFIYERCFRRFILGMYLDVPPTNLRFQRTENGKPYLPDFQDAHFNISTSGRRIFLVIGNQPVGLDVEILTGEQPKNQTIHYLNRYRAASSTSLPGHMDEVVFKSWWSSNEAVQKLLDVNMDSFTWEVPLDPAERRLWTGDRAISLLELSVKQAVGWIAFHYRNSDDAKTLP